MARYIVGRGTLLNTATVGAGALFGLGLGELAPEQLKSVALAGIGLFTLGFGVKLFLETRNPLIVAGALAFGGVLGVLLHLHAGLEAFTAWAERELGQKGSGTFQEAVISTGVLFCVGPLTLMGCLQDALEDRLELIAIKSTMDGVVAVFAAATLGVGVLVTAGVVFVVQGTLTACATSLKRFAANERLVGEANAVGGALLVAIGLGLLEIRRLEVANYLPALALAPLFQAASERLADRRCRKVSAE